MERVSAQPKTAGLIVTDTLAFAATSDRTP